VETRVYTSDLGNYIVRCNNHSGTGSSSSGSGSSRLPREPTKVWQWPHSVDAFLTVYHRKLNALELLTMFQITSDPFIERIDDTSMPISNAGG